MQEQINRRERKKLQARKTIIDIALKKFLEKGFLETTISEIMEAANLGTGTFYNYFESKEEILKSCLAEKMNTTENDFKNILQSSVSATAKLSEILMTIGTIYEENKQLFSLYLQFNRPGVQKPQPPHGSFFKEALLRIIKEGQDHQEFRKDIPQDIIIQMFMSLMQSAMIRTPDISFSENLGYKLNLFLFGLTDNSTSSR